MAREKAFSSMRLSFKFLSVLLALAATAIPRIGVRAGRKDYWGEGTLVNLPSGRSRQVPDNPPEFGAPEPIEVPCQCSDAVPRDYNTGLTYVDSCLAAKEQGLCDADLMFYGASDLIPEHYCQITCNRCNCCLNLREIISSNGGQQFLSLVDQDSEVRNFLENPGSEATVLVPNDQAIQAAIQKYGNDISVSDVLKYHILPPNEYNALWTTPFMSLGPEMQTWNQNAGPLKSSKFNLPQNTTWRGGLTGFDIIGANNKAKVVQSDIPACKGYVNIIDTVLLP